MTSLNTPLLPDTNWLNSINVGLLWLRKDIIVHASSSCNNLLGWPADRSLVGQDFDQILQPCDTTGLYLWLDTIQKDPLLANTFTLIRGTKPIRLFASPPDNTYPQDLILITITPVSPSEMAEELRGSLKEFLDGDPVPTFVLSADHTILHWNHACETIICVSATEMVGTRNQWCAFYPNSEPRPTLADLVLDNAPLEEARKWYGNSLDYSSIVPNAYEAAHFFPHMGSSGRWLRFTATPIRSARGQLIGAIETLVDITDLKQTEEELRRSHEELENVISKRTEQLQSAKLALEADIARREWAERELLTRNSELTDLNAKLINANDQIQAAQNQLLQNEKLASIGQLAAGVAHEINNPIGYVFSNFGTLNHYLKDLLSLIQAYVAAEPSIADTRLREQLVAQRKDIDLDYLSQDTLTLMNESREGIERVRKIVQDLKDFSHVDSSQEWQWTDLTRGLESTLNIVNNEIKYRADVVREYASIPNIQCLPSQLNQVFMNLLVNAAHAMEKRPRGIITVRTRADNEHVWVEINDTGCGMPPDIVSRIFDPFFTTKPVGKGTGLGLSLSYGIIQKHHGKIEVHSEVGVGTSFRITLPIRQSISEESS